MNYKDWMSENLSRDDLNSIINHGMANACIGGMIYYNELHKLYEEYESDLWDILIELSTEMGYRNHFDFIAQAKPDIECQTHFEGFIVWAATEYLAQSVLDDMPKRWMLTHIGSGHVDYFETEEEAEAERQKCYEEAHTEVGQWEDYCEYWIIEEERD